MKKFILTLCIVSVSLSAKSKSVVDYFQVFAKEGKEEILKPEITDTKNGYIKFSPLQAEGFGEFVIWKEKFGKVLVGITNYSCGPACGLSSIRFYSFDKNMKYKEISTEVFSETEMNRVFDKKLAKIQAKGSAGDETLWVKLPRKGKDIEFGIMSGQNDNETFIPAGIAKFTGTGFKIQAK